MGALPSTQIGELPIVVATEFGCVYYQKDWPQRELSVFGGIILPDEWHMCLGIIFM